MLGEAVKNQFLIERAEKMAKGKRVFKCEKCGQTFTSGRGLGQHYGENETHRPAGKVVVHRQKKGTATLSATDLITAAVEKLAGEINEKRALLANIETIKTDITKLENQRKALQAMLPQV